MSEQKLEVFNFLNYLNKGLDFEYIVNEGQFRAFSSAEECVKYLTDEGYLEGESGAALTSEEVSKKYTVAELKDILRDNGLKVSGKKQELIDRVLPVLNNESGQTELIGGEKSTDDFKLTQKARDFLEENQWIELYMFALVAFRFEDYETFKNNSSSDMIQTAHKFCDEIISRALINNYFLVFIDALSAKAHVYAYDDDYDSFMDYDLQRFILGLNPIVMDAQTYATYEIVSAANIGNMKKVNDELDLGSLKKRFERIWNKSHIKSITVPKKAAFKILTRAMDGADIEELNFDLREKYFDRKFGV